MGAHTPVVALPDPHLQGPITGGRRAGDEGEIPGVAARDPVEVCPVVDRVVVEVEYLLGFATGRCGAIDAEAGETEQSAGTEDPTRTERPSAGNAESGRPVGGVVFVASVARTLIEI